MTCMSGSSTSASKNGPTAAEGLQNRCLTPAAFSCATSSAPPVPRICRIQGGAAARPGACATNGASESAMASAAVTVRPAVPRALRNCRRETPRSRNCLMRAFIRDAPCVSELERHVMRLEDLGEVEGHDSVADLVAHDHALGLGVQRDPTGHLEEAPADGPAGPHVAVVVNAEDRHFADVVELLRPV